MSICPRNQQSQIYLSASGFGGMPMTGSGAAMTRNERPIMRFSVTKIRSEVFLDSTKAAAIQKKASI
jgi:hypothetical protein